MEDETIAKKIQLKREGVALITNEKSKKSKEVPMLLRDMEKLTIRSAEKTDITSFH